MKKSDEIKRLSLEELKSRLKETRDQYHHMRFSHSVAAIENPMKIRVTRRLIARMMTLIAMKTAELAKGDLQVSIPALSDSAPGDSAPSDSAPSDPALSDSAPGDPPPKDPPPKEDGKEVGVGEIVAKEKV